MCVRKCPDNHKCVSSILDEHFQPQEKIFDGISARVIQHEYDHLEGILFTDHLGMLKKQLLSKQLSRISKGDYRPKYKMIYP
jgi:peptide deformylase